MAGYVGVFEGTELGSHAFMASTLLIETSPQPLKLSPAEDT